MKLTKDVEFIIKRLNAGGHRADIVGGPVRDFLRGVSPSDYDITTDATPTEVKRVFEDCRTVDTGIKHGTVTLVLDNEPYEITTYRIDGDYIDARHPETVKFTEKIEEDLSRRDFTMNAIAYNPTDGITDPFSGREDIEAEIIRAVGDPMLRFSEDALRILRGLRFSATFGFQIEEKTAEALREKCYLLDGISKERIYTEWKKLLSGDFAYDVIKKFPDVISVFLPELKAVKLPEREDFAENFLTRETELFYLSAKNPAVDFDTAMRRLKTDTATRTLGVKMLENVGKYRLKTLFDAGVMLMNLGSESAFYTLMLDIALGKNEKESIKLLENYIEKKLPYRLSDLAVCGSDITELGLRGKAVGDLLQKLLLFVVKGEMPNEKKTLLQYVKMQNM